MRYTPEVLQLWERPEYYIGAQWPDYYVFLGQHRDSDTLARSNFECGLKAIGGESASVVVARASHWAVGWVEVILIHRRAGRALRKADELALRLQDYPVIDEAHWSSLEREEAEKSWRFLPIKERLALCKLGDVSPFAARRNELPSDENGKIFEALT